MKLKLKPLYLLLLLAASSWSMGPVYTLMNSKSASDEDLLYSVPVIKGITYADCMLAKNNYDGYSYCVEIVIKPLDRAKLMEAYDG